MAKLHINILLFFIHFIFCEKEKEEYVIQVMMHSVRVAMKCKLIRLRKKDDSTLAGVIRSMMEYASFLEMSGMTQIIPEDNMVQEVKTALDFKFYFHGNVMKDRNRLHILQTPAEVVGEFRGKPIYRLCLQHKNGVSYIGYMLIFPLPAESPEVEQKFCEEAWEQALTQIKHKHRVSGEEEEEILLRKNWAPTVNLQLPMMNIKGNCGLPWGVKKTVIHKVTAKMRCCCYENAQLKLEELGAKQPYLAMAYHSYVPVWPVFIASVSTGEMIKG